MVCVFVELLFPQMHACSVGKDADRGVAQTRPDNRRVVPSMDVSLFPCDTVQEILHGLVTVTALLPDSYGI